MCMLTRFCRGVFDKHTKSIKTHKLHPKQNRARLGDRLCKFDSDMSFASPSTLFTTLHTILSQIMALSTSDAASPTSPLTRRPDVQNSLG